jgi:hypothetical protein
VGIERHGDRGRAALGGHAVNAIEDFPVSAVHAVEVAER